ncbi:MAG: phosphoribosylamine--glycine ligase, partial [bacterium]|nr:phosphoribosylamine--glycine ligase [bacterium]
RKEGLLIFGPIRAAAMMEASKYFAKQIMAEASVPTGKFAEFTDFKKACQYAQTADFPVVIKADGLAKGKGVFIIKNREEARDILSQIMEKKIFSQAGERVVIEEFLEGEEFTVLSFTDGKTVSMMPVSQDHKKLLDHDEGPNTGGMGAFAPVPLAGQDLHFIRERILLPVIQALKKRNIPYQGVLYAGLIRTKDGFKVLEFNCRLGDPETQVILPLLRTDLMDIILAVLNNRLDKIKIRWEKKKVLSVVAVSQGYPDHYEKGFPVTGLKRQKGILVFHAGTAIRNNVLVTNGGRVLNVTAVSGRFSRSREMVYEALGKIHFKNIFFRTDIGKRFLS